MELFARSWIGKSIALQTSVAMTNKQFVFIIGSPRSGTTWLHSILGDHSAVASIAPVELTHFSNYLPALMDRWDAQKKNLAEGITQGLPAIWSDEEFLEFIYSFTAKVYGKVLDRNPSATHIVDKHPNYSNYTDLILRLYPDAKFIHVIRDGRDVVISSKSAKARANFMHDDVSEMAQKWIRFIGNSRKLHSHSEHYFEVKYEEMLAEPATWLMKILEFCKLSNDSALVADLVSRNSIQNKPVSSVNTGIDHLRNNKKALYVQQLTLEERYIFDVIAGPLMRELGYASDNSWIFENAADHTRLLAIKAKYKFSK